MKIIIRKVNSYVDPDYKFLLYLTDANNNILKAYPGKSMGEAIEKGIEVFEKERNIDEVFYSESELLIPLM